MVATFNGNSSTSLISFYSPTKVNEETELIAFYNHLSSLARSISKHNVLVTGGNMNSKSGKTEATNLPYNRNGLHLTHFTIENRLTCLNTNFQKREEKLWTNTYAKNTKAQIDCVFINKRWDDSAVNCKAYSSFEGVSSDNCYSKNTTEPTKECDPNNDHRTLWQGLA